MKPEKFKELAKGCPWRMAPNICRATIKDCREKNCGIVFWITYLYTGRKISKAINEELDGYEGFRSQG